MFLSSLSDRISVTLVACSEYSAKFTPDLALSEILDGPKGSGVPAVSNGLQLHTVDSLSEPSQASGYTREIEPGQAIWIPH